MSFYLDASAVVPRLVRQRSTLAVDRFFAAHPEQMWLSEYGAAEVSSAISRLVRMKEMPEADASLLLSEFDAWRGVWTKLADVTLRDLQTAHDRVRHFALMLRTPDALHLAVAQRLGATLVTLDDRLADGAKALGLSYETP